MGRSKYLAPVYASLEDSGQHDLGVQWFDENKDFYHPVAATTVAGILGIEDNQVTDNVITPEQKSERVNMLEAVANNLEHTLAKYLPILQ